MTSETGLSGIYPLQDGRDAFAARIHLAESAGRTLDVQYYIWRADLSGALLFQALLRAADRGVRVRLLLDDLNTVGLDAALASLDAHPNVEVRLFNPFRLRRLRWCGYVTDFRRLNRRMHNKSFTADGRATIIGGRNVGDEYFDAAEGVTFVDLDVLAVGPVVADVARDFERYWSCASACPVTGLLPRVSRRAARRWARTVETANAQPRAVAYDEAIRALPISDALATARLPLVWAPTRMVSDAPAKALGRAKRNRLFPEQLRALFGAPSKSLDLVSAYFVPSDELVDTLTGFVAGGARVRVLTNAFEATDVAVVHAGYAHQRRRLLRGGVRLYERKRVAGAPRGPRRRLAGSVGSRGTSLHAKTFAVDRARVFVGSFNFDPRSALHNTELGFVIDSPVLARQLEAVFDERVPEVAYEVQLEGKRRLAWVERAEDGVVRHAVEPGMSLLQRAGVRALSWLPIDELL